MSEQNMNVDEQYRIRSGQSAARGATGDGETGVPAGEQGISNRPGDAEADSDEDDPIQAQGPQPEDANEGREAGADEGAPIEDDEEYEDGEDEEAEDDTTELPVEPR